MGKTTVQKIMKKDHFLLTRVAQKRLCLSSLLKHKHERTHPHTQQELLHRNSYTKKTKVYVFKDTKRPRITQTAASKNAAIIIAYR